MLLGHPLLLFCSIGLVLSVVQDNINRLLDKLFSRLGFAHNHLDGNLMAHQLGLLILGDLKGERGIDKQGINE